jgi:hypothetical protein
MAEVRERYRKLPGRRRGFIKGSSVWMGSDHLLLVNSTRFREDYKRFYLRDIQAIVVAAAPRFEFSTRAALAGFLWVLWYFSFRNRAEWASGALWFALLCAAGAWLYIGAARSCRCRIYTAVSSDELPSVNRTWVARRFLAAVEPRIGGVQGVIEGPWAEAAESRQIGPPVSAALGEPGKPAQSTARSRTPVSDIFIASLFADALLNLFTLNSLTRTLQGIWYGLAFIEVAAAILIFVQYHRRVLRVGMQRLAVATLILMGIAYYVRAAMSGMMSATNQLFPDVVSPTSTPAYVLMREIDAAATLVLACIGAGMAFLGDNE